MKVQYGGSQIVIEGEPPSLTVYVWDNQASSTSTIGHETLPKTHVQTVEEAKQRAIAAIASERGMPEETVRRDLDGRW